MFMLYVFNLQKIIKLQNVILLIKKVIFICKIA